MNVRLLAFDTSTELRSPRAKIWKPPGRPRPNFHRLSREPSVSASGPRQITATACDSRVLGILRERCAPVAAVEPRSVSGDPDFYRKRTVVR